jgi:sugar phosphate isomerase/epimerase
MRDILKKVQVHVPFGEILARVRERNVKPILTIESPSEEGLRRMVENIRSMRLLERF